MPHHNSVFHEILEQFPWEELKHAVERHDGADRARTFSYKSQFVALLYGQLAGAPSLRAIEDGLQSHTDRLYHVGATPALRTTLADANHYRPAAVFSDLLAVMIARAHPQLRQSMTEATYLIDSTSLKLNALSAKWARFSADCCGAKVHVVYDADADCPIYAAVTAANVNDITAAQDMPIIAKATYVFDLGYYHYAWWAKFIEADCRIVTRLKKNTPLRVIETRPVSGDTILLDQVGHLPGRLSGTRQNPVQKPVREIRVRIQTGKILRVVTNDLTAPAQEIADLYKRRWAIELFFRWIKQTLKIDRFLGNSNNAVRIQIAVALIAFLLLRMAQAAQRAIKSPLAFARVVAANLMHCKPIACLQYTPRMPTAPPQQSSFRWNIPALDHV